jgi:hypothetical protein
MTETLLRKQKIYQVDPCPETPDTWKEKQEQEFELYGAYFKNREEFEYFVMLPLSDEQRCQLLRVMKNESDFRIQLEKCTGEDDYGQEHRKYCIECVTTHKPAWAIPYFK